MSFRNALLLIVAGIPLFGRAQTEQEPNDNSGQANALAASTTTTGNINCGNTTADWFVLTTPADGLLSLAVNVSNTGTPGSVQVQVFNSGGGLLANNGVASGNPAVLEYPCYAAGLYYIQVYGNSPDCYNYSLNWSLSQPLYANDSEPNNNTTEADVLPAITPGNNINGHVNFLNYPNNADYYRIVTTDQGSITFTMIAENAGAANATGLQMQMFNSGGGLLENWSTAVGGDGSPDTTVITTYCRGAGAYYIHIYANASCGVSYRLRFNGTAPVYANDTENNDNSGQATNVAYDMMTEGRLAFYYDDNDDWFAITPSDQGIIHIEVMAENVGALDNTGLQVQLFNSGGGLLENWSVAVGGNMQPTTTTVNTVCKGAGTYFVRFFANALCGVSYRWRYSGSAPYFANDTESNDNTGEANVAEYDSEEQGRLAFYYDDNDDWYRIDPPDQGIIHIEVMAENAGGADLTGLQVQFFNEGGGLLNNWSVAVGGNVEPTTTVVSTTCKGTGIYYVRFYANSPCGVSYSWRYYGSAPFYANDAESNDNTNEATDAAYNDPMQGRLAFNYDDNDDWYSIDPPDQGIIHIEVMAENVGAADGTGLQVQFFNSGGGLLGNWSVPVGGNVEPDTGVVSTLCKGTGTYYVRFYANSPCGVSYKWRYYGTAPVFGNDAEDNDNSAQADTVGYNTGMDGRIAFYYDDNDDWYAITPADESIIHIEVRAEHVGDADATGVQVQFFNSGGGLLENWSIPVGGASEPTNTTLNTYCKGAGLYYVRFYANSPCGVSYSWKYTATDPAFGADPEPDNNIAEAVPISLVNWWQDGRLSFYYGDNADWYSFILGGAENITVNTSAEHPGDGGTMQVQLFNGGGGLLGNLSADVGANGVSVEDAADFGAFPAGTYYLQVYANGICGVSYRLLCHDTDNDGICDGTAMQAEDAHGQALGLTARPNPSIDGLFTISSSFVPAWVRVRDMSGRMIQSERKIASGEWKVDLSQYPAGVYTVQVGDNRGEVVTTRLMRH